MEMVKNEDIVNYLRPINWKFYMKNSNTKTDKNRKSVYFYIYFKN